MALNFPDNPTTNDYFTDNTSGFSYQWNGTAWISVGSTATTQIKELDNISGSFDDSTQTFSLTIAGSAVYPVSINQITIILGGILQNAGDDFTLSGNQITFTTPPATGLSFAGMFYGSSVSMNSPTAGSIGTAALSTGGPVWNTGGDVTVAGIVTVGSSSVVIDGPSNELRVGTGATINESGIVIGIITATTFYGDGSNIQNVTSGIGTTGSANTSGIITASYFYGAGIGLTNIGGATTPILYNPGIGQTNVGVSTNIIITFNKPIIAVGDTITIREGSAVGVVTESFTVGVSTLLNISGGVLTIGPTSNLSAGTTYYVVVPAGAFKDILGTTQNVGITSYYFETAAAGGGGEISAPFELYMVGDNTSALGQNDGVARSSPIQVPGTQWDSGVTSRNSSFATKTDGTLWSWGSNGQGTLGINSIIDRSSPIQVPGTQWDNPVSTRQNAALASKTDGTLWSWGTNVTDGTLGLNSTINRSSPTQIPGTQWVLPRYQSNEGVGMQVAFKTDGTLWVWGSNGNGQLGITDVVPRSSPHQIPGTQWDYNNGKYAQSDISLAIKTDGTLWGWGWNATGLLGLNDALSRSSPVQIPGTQWTQVAAGQGSFGIKSDGTLWVFGGRGSSGGLGLNDTVQYSSPQQIPGTQWRNISNGNYFTTATKTDGTLWGWGGGTRLGLNDAVNRSSPTQIPGTQWAYTVSGEANSMYMKTP